MKDRERRIQKAKSEIADVKKRHPGKKRKTSGVWEQK
jgi:hypothetical protein